MLTGARTEELRALRWEHVRAEPIGTVPPHIEVWRSVRFDGDTKTKKSRRTLALPARCIEALRKQKAQQAADRLAAGERWRRLRGRTCRSLECHTAGLYRRPRLEPIQAKGNRESGSQIQGDHEYLFKHMLIREVAYATLPRAARRERHAAVARFIESAAGERIEEAAALLAHHWQEAGDVDQAIRFLQLAAEHAAKGWAKDVAVALFGQALQLVPENQPELRRAIAIRRAETQVELGDLGAAAALDKLLEETEGRERLKVLMARAHTAHWAMDAEGATRMSQEAFDLAQSLSIEEFIGPALALQSLASSMAGNMNTSLAAEPSQEILSAAGSS